MSNVSYCETDLRQFRKKTSVAVELPVIESREPLSTLQSFCQSKTLVASSGVNPLVAASAALFSLIIKLGQTHKCHDVEKLRSDLVYEIKAFESNACAQGYSPDVILLGRFALCASLDEIIRHTHWGRHSLLWKEKNLLTIFQGDEVNNELFFTVLEKLQSYKNLPVDLLELIYLCLSLGFLGKTRASQEEQKRLESLLDSYFQRVRLQRADISEVLSDTAKVLPVHDKTKVQPISLWLIFFITTLLLICIYSGFNYMLGMTTSPLYSKLDSLTNTLNYETIT